MPNEISGRFPRDERAEDAELTMPPPGYRTRRQAGADRGMRRMAIIAAGLGGALLLAAGAWSIIGHGNRSVPVVQALTGPVRMKPENRGGMQVTGADEPLLGGASGPEKQALAPPPEQPDPQALRAQADAARKAAAMPASSATGATVAPAQPAPAVAPAAGPAAKAPQLAQARPPAPPSPAGRAKAEPPAPAASRGTAPAHPAAEHGAVVQLAALRSEQAAKAEWARLDKQVPGLFSGHRPKLIRVERDGHVFWRLRTDGFADRGKATTFCERVRATGAGCSIASF